MSRAEPTLMSPSATDVRALAIRFADLWAVDPHQMVEEIYAADIRMESMAKPAPPIRGADELHAVEDRLAELIPEHRHELVRVLVDGDRAFLETTIVAPLTNEYAQAALWWTLADDGKVGDEIGWFDWDHRCADSRRSRGHVLPHGARSRERGEYEQLIREAARAWCDDPRALTGRCAPGCSVDLVGRASWTGEGAVADAIDAAVRAAPEAVVEVLEVLGDGCAVAALVTIATGGRTTRGSIVLTLDPDGSATSVRAYVDWNRAISRTTTTVSATPARGG
jgi:hypothetical protein